MRCFGFGWDLVSAVAAGFVGRRNFGNGLYKAFNGWMLRSREEVRGSTQEGTGKNRGIMAHLTIIRNLGLKPRPFRTAFCRQKYKALGYFK